MLLAERAIVCLTLFLIAACLTGLFARRRQGVCVSFNLYLGAVLFSDLLVFLWPEHFHVWKFWIVKETVHNVLKFGIALELTLRTFRAFPAARRTAAGLVLGVLLLTWFSLAWFSVGPTPRLEVSWRDLALGLQPYILAGTVWLFIAISVLVLWYRLPVVPLHKALLLGFVPYLLIFTVAMNLLRSWGGDHVRIWAGYVKNVAYVALLAYWTYTAWRRWPPTGAGRRQGSPTPPPA